MVSLVGRDAQATGEVASKFNIPHVTTDLAQSLAQPGVEAAMLATPTQLHASQAVQCLEAGKHVMIEIPIADSLADSQRVVDAQQRQTAWSRWAGIRAASTRVINGSTSRIKAGELKVLQMDVQTYFFRRTNMNALGKPRSWTDHLLWHHACHTVDLFQYQTGERVSQALRCRDRPQPDARDCHGYEYRHEGSGWRDLHAVAVLQ